MSSLARTHLPAWPATARSRLRVTVRVRLTLLYGGLFLASGVGLLAITYLLFARALDGPPFAVRTPEGAAIGDTPALRAAARQQAAGELHRLLAPSGIALAFMAVIAMALGWLVAGRVLRPLRAMTAATQQITSDNLHQRLALAGPRDELTDLSDTIDGLLGRLAESFDAQRRFVANASHELRTPLAMMRMSLDVAMAKPEPVPPHIHALDGKLREGLGQADQIMESFLLLARMQHGVITSRTTVSLPAVLATVIHDRAPAILAQDIQVRQTIHDARVAGSQTLLSRLVANLIDNAIRHNERGGWIHVQTAVRGPVARLIVESGGRVLDQDRVRQLAQPFVRLGADRTGSGHGAGLGLSIVAAIADAHGGTLHLEALPQGGLRVLIELPRPTRAADGGDAG
jgi:hypothetical protein